jgi:cytochrome P450
MTSTDSNESRSDVSASRYARLLENFNQFDPEFEANFYEVANELRQRCPVAHSNANDGFWTFSRHADVEEGFTDGDRFSTVPTTTIPVNPGAVPILPLQADASVHRDFRKLLDPFFRPRAIAKYSDGIRQVTNELIDMFIERGSCDFVEEFARPLPGRFIFRSFLGLPESDVPEAFRLTLAIMHSLGTDGAATVHRDFIALIQRMLDERRKEKPRGDVIDALFEGTVQGRPITEDERMRIVLMLIAAGLDTTAHSVATMMLALARRPELRARLDADPEVLPRAIEELLRWEPPAGALVRTAMQDIVKDDQRIAAGDRILLLVAAANRDPEEYALPDEIDFDRENVRHLSFGYAAHYCLGVHLARLELRVAWTEILHRMKDIRLADEGHVEYESGTSRGPLELRLRFTPGPRLEGAAEST